MALPAFVFQPFVLWRDNNSVLWQYAAVKLPNADKAVVVRAKLADYLLNAAHPDNHGKRNVAAW